MFRKDAIFIDKGLFYNNIFITNDKQLSSIMYKFISQATHQTRYGQKLRILLFIEEPIQYLTNIKYS